VRRAAPIAPAQKTARVTAMPEKLPPGQGASDKDCGRVLFAECECSRSVRWCSWLRHCATSRKVAGSIPHWDFSLIRV
jgi:hypothetical protein